MKWIYLSRIKKALTMDNDNQNHWGYGFCPSSGILNNCKTQRFGSASVLRRGKREILLGPLVI
jgi:hypothetical protein